MIFPAGSQAADDAHESELWDVAVGRGVLPRAGLVHERLPDVEYHRGYSHDAIFARSSAVVTFKRSGSPSTTLTRPPAASTRPAQSVAAAPLATARRSTSAGNACGVWTV